MTELDNLELYEEREREILERLGQMSMNDPERKSLTQELNVVSSIIVNYKQTELTRLNNNARNDIDEARLVIEGEKVQNDKTRNKIMVGGSILSVLAGWWLHGKSYHMDEKGYPFKEMKQFSKDMVDGKYNPFRR